MAPNPDSSLPQVALQQRPGILSIQRSGLVVRRSKLSVLGDPGVRNTNLRG